MTPASNIDVDLGGATTKEQIPEQLALAFGFPDYYGKNWDAFWECVNELETMPRQIRIKGMASLAASFPLEAALLRKRLENFRATSEGSRINVQLD